MSSNIDGKYIKSRFIRSNSNGEREQKDCFQLLKENNY